MGRWATYPATVDSLRTIDISFLSKEGYIKRNNNQSGTITWMSSGGTKNSISIWVHTGETDGFMKINYTYRETDKIEYTVELVTRPSNLGKGLIWFFVCPQTGKYCRKLYFYRGYFLHRSAFGLMYNQQIESKTNRIFSRLGRYNRLDPYETIYSKHFKTHYNGKPTKRYKRLSQLIQDGERLENMVLGVVKIKLEKLEGKTKK